MISFTISGNPVPQPRPRISTKGGFARGYVPKQHPVHAYRQAVALAAATAGLGPRRDPIVVRIWAEFARPKSHRTSRGALKPTAPLLPRPDIDNIAKAVLDALRGMFDDTLVADLHVTKRYGSHGSTTVEIE